MNIAIVDDLETDRLSLEQTLREYNSIHRLGMTFCQFSSGKSLLQDYQPFRYAIVFLDIFMGDLSGIETARAIREADDDVTIIFLTTSESHMPEAYSLFAAAYLRKPISKSDVFRTLDHLLRIRTQEGQRFEFSYGRQDYKLRLADIVSLEKVGNYMCITDRSGQAYRTRMTFSKAETQVDSQFLVLMKGLMVNMAYIKQIRNNQCLMRNGMIFPLNVKNARVLQQKWLNYKFAAIRSGTSELENDQ